MYIIYDSYDVAATNMLFKIIYMSLRSFGRCSESFALPLKGAS